MRRFAPIVALLLSLLAAAAWALVPVPPLQARVTDLTGTLSPVQRQTLERELAEFEARKGSQLAVLLLPTTRPESIEQYGIRVGEAWQLGRKGVDDGAVLIVAKDDRELRIEVGYGLEGVIPDAVANRVIDEIIVPFFRQGDYYGGIHAGVTRLMRLIDGEPLPPPAARDRGWEGAGDWLAIGLVFVFVVGGLLRLVFGRFLGATVAGSIAAVVFWLLVGSLLAALVVWFVVFVFTLAGGARPGRMAGWPGSGGYRGHGGFGGGGGFRGGGGGFGGGGASGRW